MLHGHGVKVGWLNTQPIALSDGKCQQEGVKDEARRYTTDQRSKAPGNCSVFPKKTYYRAVDCPNITDTRFPHVLDAYNLIARRVARRAGVDYVDTWQAQLDLIDTPGDGTHFNTPPVAPRLAHLVWRWLAKRR